MQFRWRISAIFISYHISYHIIFGYFQQLRGLSALPPAPAPQFGAKTNLYVQKPIWGPFSELVDDVAPWINANERMSTKHAAFNVTETFLLFLALFQGQ